MPFLPDYAGNDGLLAPADFDVAAALRRLSSLDADAVRRQVEDADVVPRYAASHACPDHDLLSFFAMLHFVMPARARKVGTTLHAGAH